MTVPTFSPLLTPSTDSSDKPEFTTLSADFGDGYTQATHQLNNVRRVVTLIWKVLPPNYAVAIYNFLTDQAGTEPFYYTMPSEFTPVLWTCKDFDMTYTSGGYRSINAIFRQSFNAVS